MTVTQPIADRHLLRELTTLELILPAHNEEAAIAQTVQDWLAAFDHGPFEFRILVAEDGSKDETRAVVERLASRFPSRVRLTPPSARKGYSKAVLDAARVVNATLTAFCDGDGQFDPRELDRLAREVQPGVLVAGCRSPRVDSRFRVAASTAFGIVYRLLIGLKMEDPSSPFVVIRTDDLRTFLPERTHLAQGFWWEFFARAGAAGLTITEVPVTHRVRADGGRTQVYRAHKLPQIIATHVRGLVRLRREVRALDGTPTEGGRNEPPRGGSGEFQPWNGVCTTEAEPFPENGLVRVADTGAASTRSDKEAASSPRLVRSAVDPDGWLDGWDSADSTRRENGRLKILIIATESPPVRGGIAQSVRFISDGLRRRGHHVDVLAYPRVRRAVMGEVRVSSMAVHLIRNARRIANYDIINVHGVTPTVSDAALLAVRATRRRPALVYTHHVNVDFGPIGPVNALYNRLHRRLSASADKCVATTNAGLAALGDCGSVIAFGVDGQFLDDVRAKSGPYTVIYVGQFRPWKGVPILLDAVSRIGGARLIIAGHGNAAERYEQLAAELRIDAEFHVDVRTDELKRLYDRAHVIVLPSTSHLEGFGLVLLEGMARGCVPVASDLAGVREALGRIGFTFPPGSASQLAAVLAKLRDDAELRAGVARRARDRAMSFTWDRTVAEYDRLFRDVADIRPCREDIRRGKPAAAGLESLPGKLKSETDATHGTSAIRSRR